MDTNDQSQRPLPHEEGYGSPTAEEEMPPTDQKAQPAEESSQPADSAGQPAAEGSSNTSEEAPSTDAEIEEDNTEEASGRESFSSESDEEGSGLPDE